MSHASLRQLEQPNSRLILVFRTNLSLDTSRKSRPYFQSLQSKILCNWSYVFFCQTKQEAQLPQWDSASVSRLANWTCNSLNAAAVVQLYRLGKVVSTLSAKKPSDRWRCLTLYNFKVICLCIIRKPLIAFIIISITNGHKSQDVWEMTLHNVKNYQF